jgi:hypothetical protein
MLQKNFNDSWIVSKNQRRCCSSVNKTKLLHQSNMSLDNLPAELWDKILQYVLEDSGMYLPVIRVCQMFKALAVPYAPRLYVNEVLYASFVPDGGIVSVRRVKKFFGNWSGLACSVRNLFTVIGRNRSHNAWLQLKPQLHGWFEVEDVFWRSKKS